VLHLRRELPLRGAVYIRIAPLDCPAELSDSVYTALLCADTWQYTRLVLAHAYFEERCEPAHCGYQFLHILCYSLYFNKPVKSVRGSYVLIKYEFQ
jgi:hypothetical protein